MVEPEPRRHGPGLSLRRLAPFVFLSAGIAIGILISQAIQVGSKPVAVRSSGPSVEPSTLEPPNSSEPKPEELPIEKPESKPSDPEAPPAEPPTKADPVAMTPAPNPLSGSLSGGLPPSGNVAPVTPIVIERDEPRSPSVTYMEYMIIVPEVDVAPTVQRIMGLIRSAGGQMNLNFLHDPDRPEAGHDLVAGIPATAASKVLEELQGIRGAQETDRWSGPQADRLPHVQRFLRNAAYQLDRKLGQLKIRYLDDAPDVVRTSESLARYRKALSDLKAASVSQQTVRVYVGKSLPAVG